MTEQNKPEEFQTQAWICPKCFDDHSMKSECSPLSNEVFMPHESDHSYIADKYRELFAENKMLKQENEKLREERNDYMKKTSELTSLCLKLREDLKFYADRSNWNCSMIRDSDISTTKHKLTGGKRARQALKDFVVENGTIKAYQNSGSELKPLDMENAVKIERKGSF